jgi:hypothetical protein
MYPWPRVTETGIFRPSGWRRIRRLSSDLSSRKRWTASAVYCAEDQVITSDGSDHAAGISADEETDTQTAVFVEGDITTGRVDCPCDIRQRVRHMIVLPPAAAAWGQDLRFVVPNIATASWVWSVPAGMPFAGFGRIDSLRILLQCGIRT